MESVPETLKELVGRRLREMGTARGRNEPLSLLEVFNAVQGPQVTYELVRRVEKGEHTNIGDKAVRTIATMLAVDENEVRAAAGQRPSLGPFRLPPRADRLERHERQAVLSVVDAILTAGDRATVERKQRRRRLGVVEDVATAAMEPERRGEPRRRERPGESTDPYIDGA